MAFQQDLMLQVVDRIESAIEAAQAEHDRKTEALIANASEEDEIDIGNDSADETMLLMGPVTEFARRAMLITVYAQLEDELKTLCRAAYKLKMSAKPVPQNNFHLKAAKAHIVQIAFAGQTFNAAVFGNAWKDIEDGWRALRNVLAHDDGMLESNVSVEDPESGNYLPLGEASKDAEAVKAFVATHNKVKLRGDLIELERGAVEDFINDAASALAPIEEEFLRVKPPSTRKKRPW
jgi:hypothetical protein